MCLSVAVPNVMYAGCMMLLFTCQVILHQFHRFQNVLPTGRQPFMSGRCCLALVRPNSLHQYRSNPFTTRQLNPTACRAPSIYERQVLPALQAAGARLTMHTTREPLHAIGERWSRAWLLTCSDAFSVCSAHLPCLGLPAQVVPSFFP